MKLTFLGAAREVTGSCYLLEINGKNLLVDCGMAQGPDIYETQILSVNPQKIHAVLLTHAHIDHSGLLPLLAKNKFKGKIYLTRPTRDLACIMLKDSAHIQKSEADWRNKRAKRAGLPQYKPLYVDKDVLSTIKLFKACDYETDYEIFSGITIKFYDAGHLLGSSSISITAKENGSERTVVFSGDIGNVNKPILKDPTYLTKADYVITESTYGDKVHEKEPDHVNELARVIQRTLDRGGNVVIPTFAVGRMQEMLYYIHEIKERNLVVGHNEFPVYVDSPLAVEATKIFSRKYDCFDEKMTEMIDAGINPLTFDGLRLSVSVEDSKAINNDPTPKVILSASGMCEAGRIKHHLKYNLWRKESCVLFVGYQVDGTLGRRLLDGVKTVNLLGENICVDAEVTKMVATSSHADSVGLLKWIKSYSPKPKRVFVTHGDEKVSLAYTETLKINGFDATCPKHGECWDLLSGVCIKEGENKKRTTNTNESEQPPKSNAYYRLEQAVKTLNAIVRENQGGTNYDLNNFTLDVEKLCEKWKREE